MCENIGLLAAREDVVFEVAVIRPDGPSEAGGSGWRSHCRTDGQTVSGFDPHRYRKLISAPPGTVIELKLAEGKKVSIELGPPLDW